MLTIFVASTFLMVMSSSDRLPALLRGTVAEAVLSQFAIGVIVSLLIYVLVVRVPERSKRKRVRRSLRLQYNSFKEESIKVFLGSLQGSYNPDLVERLKDREEFRRFFKEPVSPHQDRWHAVLNGLNEDRIKSLVIELEILMAEIHFTLNVIDVDHPAAFAFLKRLAHVLYRSKETWSPDYDNVKELAGFMWSVHTGWNFIEGYTERDVVAEMIDAI